MQISGRLVEISATQNVSATFKKREFVVEYVERQYPEFIKFETIQDKCDLLDSFVVGGDVTIDFNLKGRKWNSPQGEVKYFNTLQAWRIEAGAPQPADDIPTSMEPPAFEDGIEEEVPF
jgi:hypothetical protein